MTQSKTAKITKRWLSTSTSPMSTCCWVISPFVILHKRSCVFVGSCPLPPEAGGPLSLCTGQWWRFKIRCHTNPPVVAGAAAGTAFRSNVWVIWLFSFDIALITGRSPLSSTARSAWRTSPRCAWRRPQSSVRLALPGFAVTRPRRLGSIIRHLNWLYVDTGVDCSQSAATRSAASADHIRMAGWMLIQTC